MKFNSSDVDGTLKIVLANQMFIEKENVKSRMQNQIRRIAAYSNPEFYKNQAMGFSTQGMARIVYCGSDTEDYICIPRGCEEKFIERLRESEIDFKIEEQRQSGKKINVSFSGELYPEQKVAADKMLAHENGVLAAATAFGKTAVGAYLVAQRKVNTLILVHNREIMKNWVEDFEKFLDIEEDPPEYTTPKGKVKKRKSVVGRLYASHNSVTGIIDIVMISSLGKKSEINELVKDYGMVIMDECHHAGAQTAIDVLNEVNAKYVYGLTATPKRDDGQDKKIFMQFGPIRHRYTAKDKAKAQGIEHYVYPRFTRLVHINGEKIKINDAYKEVIISDIRNQQIVDDVAECIANGRTPLVLTKFKEHAAILMEKLQSKSEHIFLLQGGKGNKERDLIREKMRSVPENETVILVAIGKYIGEGFNYPRLDTMMLTTPISYDGNVEQYAGRLHRDYEGKKDITVITLSPESYPESRVTKTRELIEMLQRVGIGVKEKETMHEHFAIIDREIVWYGSMNLLSKEKEEDNLMRVVSEEIALELMELVFTKREVCNKINTEL